MNGKPSNQNNFWLRAILSDRANYIISKMEQEGCDYSTALLDAQQHWSGRDIKDTNDLKDYEGRDSVGRLADVVEHCYGASITPQEIFCRGIAFLSPLDFEMADNFGFTIKYLGLVRVQDGKLSVRMHPTLVSQMSPLSLVSGAEQAVEWGVGGLDGHNGQNGLYVGTADSFLKVLPQLGTQTHTVANILDLNTRYYIRFTIQDTPEALSSITKVLQQNNIGIQHLYKQGEKPKSIVPLIALTHEVCEKDMRAALKEIDGMGFVSQMTKIIRIDAEET